MLKIILIGLLHTTQLGLPIIEPEPTVEETGIKCPGKDCNDLD